MKIEQPEALRHDSGDTAVNGTERSRFRTDSVMLLVVTLLALAGVAGGITLRYPWALESASAYVYGSPALASSAQAANFRDPAEEDAGENSEPFIADDIRTEGLMHVAAGIAETVSRSNPEPSERNC